MLRFRVWCLGCITALTGAEDKVTQELYRDHMAILWDSIGSFSVSPTIGLRVEGLGLCTRVKGLGFFSHFLFRVQSFGSYTFQGLGFRLGTAPPLSNSWLILIIWLYIALNRTPDIDCYWVEAVPKFQALGFRSALMIRRCEGSCNSRWRSSRIVWGLGGEEILHVHDFLGRSCDFLSPRS